MIMYVNVEETPLGELLALLPDEREADALEAEMDATLGIIDPTSGADPDVVVSSLVHLMATMGRIREIARRALADGTAVLGRPARKGKRLSPRDKLDLLPPFEAAAIRAELNAALGNINKDDEEWDLGDPAAYPAALGKLDAAVSRVLSTPAN
jgi:hypothetical protein